MDDVGRALTAMAAAAFGLAIASVIFSQRAQTSTVITSGGNAFAAILNAATSPVTGNSSVAGTAANAFSGLAGIASATGAGLGG